MSLTIDTLVTTFDQPEQNVKADAIVSKALSDKQLARLASRLNKNSGEVTEAGRVKRVNTRKSLKTDICNAMLAGNSFRSVYNALTGEQYELSTNSGEQVESSERKDQE